MSMSEEPTKKVQEVVHLPRDLPNGWEAATLAEVAEIVMGQSPSSEYYNTEGEGLPFFQGKAEFGNLYPEAVKWCSVPGKIAQKDDVLISVRAPVGPTNLAPSECCIGRGLAAIRPKSGIPSRYILHYLRSIERDVDSLGTGTTFKAISGKILREIPIPVAPLDQQARIVAEIEKQFSCLDEAVANLQRVKANLKRYKAAVLKAAVEGKLTEEWRKAHPDVEPASKLLDRILAERRAKWEEAELVKMEAKGKAPKNDKWKAKYKEPAEPDTTNLPELSEGWVWASLEMISEAVGGYAFSSKSFTSSGYQVVKMANVRMGHIDLTQRPSFVGDVDGDINQKYGLCDGDILVTLTGTRRERDYGYVAVVQNPSALLLNQRIARLRPASGIEPYFIALTLQSESYRNRFFARETGNVGQGNVGMAAVTIEAVPLAPKKEQIRIVDAIDRHLSLIRETEIQVDTNLKRAERLHQSILGKAYSGDLRPSTKAAELPVERPVSTVRRSTRGDFL